MKWCCSILVVLLCSSAAFAQSNIRVLKRNSGGLTDVTGTAEGVVNNTARTSIIRPGTGDFATDWFVRQDEVVSGSRTSIDSVTFEVPSGTLTILQPATVFHVTVGSNTTWNPDIAEEQPVGCSSLGSFTGFGQAGSSAKAASYFVQVRIGVSNFIGRVNDVGGIEANEIVRVDAKTIGTDPESYNAVVTAHGPIGIISAGQMTLQVTTNGRETVAYDPDDNIPWPYSHEERENRFDVQMLTTQQSIHDTTDTTGDINVNYSDTSLYFADNVFDIRARGHVLGKIHTNSRVERVEGWQGIGHGALHLQLHAGRGEYLKAGKLNGSGQPEIAGSFENMFAVYQEVDHTDMDGRVQLMRAVKKDGAGGDFEINATILFSGLRSTSDPDEIALFDAELNGVMVFAKDLPADKMVRIGGSETGSIEFQQADGLQGQIIVNAGDVGGTWQGSVSLSGGFSPIPDYSRLDESVGGGAVGEAPFQLHDEDCFPENGSSDPIPLWQLTRPEWVDLLDGTVYKRFRTRFYGPVFTTGTGSACEKGVTIEYHNGNNWDDYTRDFTMDAPTSAALIRDIHLGLAFDPNGAPLPAGEYRIRDNVSSGLHSSRLKCAFVTGTPPVAAFTHTFYLSPAATPADVGRQGGIAPGDGNLDNNDFIVYIGMFFSSDPMADIGVQGGVLGHDGLFDNNDFVEYINLFFLGAQNPHAHQSCSIDCDEMLDEPSSSPIVTQDPVLDRQLAALWTFYERTADARIAARFMDTLFNGAEGAADH